MAFPVAMIIPLVVQALTVTLRVADIIEKSEDVDEKDKVALRSLINRAKDGVTYIDEPANKDDNQNVVE